VSKVDLVAVKGRHKGQIDVQCCTCRVKKKCFIYQHPEICYVSYPCSSYLESLYEQKGGVTYENEVNRAFMCHQTVVHASDETEVEDFFLKIGCGKFWCKDGCGGKNGLIHKHRMTSIMQKTVFEGHFFRQFVYTVPEEHRWFFKKRKHLNAFHALVQRNIEKYFGKDHVLFSYLHLFGDPDKYNPDALRKFHPHINVHILCKENESWKITSARLEAIKKSYMHALSKLLGLKNEMAVCDVHYEYRVGKSRMRHAVRYMSRPFETDILDHVDKEMQGFLVLGMKGFQYVRCLKLGRGKKNEEFLIEHYGTADVVEKRGLVSPVTGVLLIVRGIMTFERYEMLKGTRIEKAWAGGLIQLIDNDDG
jgi:hypothetical protein